MPRRGSKKSVLEKKPKLKFVTSPLHGPAHIVSPVFGAHNPLRAKTVGIEDSNTTWVSPHFQEPVNSGRGNGKFRTGTGARTRQRCLTGDKENQTNSSHRRANRRLKSLIFVRGETDETSLEPLHSLTPSNDLRNDLEISRSMDVDTPEMLCASPDIRRTSGNSIVHSRHNARKLRADNSNRLRDICRTPSLIDSPLRILQVSYDGSQGLDNSLVRRSSRLKEKYLDSLKVARTPPKEAESRSFKILAVDTPESEYGLSVRRKQLAQLKIRTSKTPS